jgi:hypothetical protein
VPRTDGTAIAAFICAVASFVVCPVIPAIVALVLVPTSRQKIETSGGMVQGLGLLTAAKIVAWLNLALAAAVLALIVALSIASAVRNGSNASALLGGSVAPR